MALFPFIIKYAIIPYFLWKNGFVSAARCYYISIVDFTSSKQSIPAKELSRLKLQNIKRYKPKSFLLCNVKEKEQVPSNCYRLSFFYFVLRLSFVTLTFLPTFFPQFTNYNTAIVQIPSSVISQRISIEYYIFVSVHCFKSFVEALIDMFSLICISVILY